MQEQTGSMPAPEVASGFASQLWRWCRASARTLLLRRPRWDGLLPTPAVIAAFVLLNILLTLGIERLTIEGDATFYWQAITGGWIDTAVLAWASYLVCRHLTADRPGAAPGTAHLFVMGLGQATVMLLLLGVAVLFFRLTGLESPDAVGVWTAGTLYFALALWAIAAHLLLLWRGGNGRLLAYIVAALAVVGSALLLYAVRPSDFWYPLQEESEDAAPSVKLTQEIMEGQPVLLAKSLQGLAPQRPGTIDVYAITFAPYAEDVFRRESGMVADVMAQRFDATDRVVELVNHSETLESLPWATPLNLRRAIERAAQVMDKNEDVLFIHMTSHGARDGELAAGFWPLELDTVRPQPLKQWLDAAGIKHRIISVSACYSGSWIAPLSGPGTLVMTAADATHTSYGCGSQSELTFFGRAMYDEQLRSKTLSFEQAHKAARLIIDQREKEAGKDDGYSNPQISMGEGARAKLSALESQLARPQK